MRIAFSLCLLLALGAGVARAQGAPPPPPPAQSPEGRVADLVRQLGDPSFEVREAAQRELERIGAPAARALDEATRSQDPEVASRATEALARIRGGQGPTREAPPLPEERRGAPDRRLPPMPDTDELFKEMERQLQDQLPEELRPLLRMFRGFGGQEEPDAPQQDPGGAPRPRVRVFSWPNNQGEQRTELSVDGALGWELGLAPAALRAQLGLEGEGVVVNQLDPNGAAARAGVRLYDVIVGLDGRSVRSTRDLQPLSRAGGQLQLYRRAKLEAVAVPAPAGGAAPGPAPAPTPPRPSQPGEQRSF